MVENGSVLKVVDYCFHRCGKVTDCKEQYRKGETVIFALLRMFVKRKILTNYVRATTSKWNYGRIHE